MKKIYVKDSFHSEQIALVLKELYGNKAQVVTSLSKGINVFFLSAKTIVNNEVVPKELKAQFGAPQSSVVAMSIAPQFLTQVQTMDCGVTYLHDKDYLLESAAAKDVDRLPQSEKTLLLSYIQ